MFHALVAASPRPHAPQRFNSGTNIIPSTHAAHTTDHRPMLPHVHSSPGPPLHPQSWQWYGLQPTTAPSSSLHGSSRSRPPVFANLHPRQSLPPAPLRKPS
jgi:hypothetical protein